MFFNIGGGEILVIAMVTLIAVGPEQLPGVLRKVGRAMSQVRSMTAGLREEFMAGLDEVRDVADPEAWMGGSGSDTDPIVPRGYAQRQAEATTAEKAENAEAVVDTVAEPSSNGEGGRVNEIAKANARSSPPVTPEPEADAQPEVTAETEVAPPASEAPASTDGASDDAEDGEDEA